MKIKLREYQKRLCRRTWDAFVNGVDGTPVTRVLATAGTGAGKTIMASALIWMAVEKVRKRCLFLADTDELVDQAVKKVYAATGIIPSIEKGTSRASRHAQVVIGSIQTMAQPKRLEGWAEGHFGMVIADEAHLSMAPSWQRVLKKFNQDGRGAWTLGITATPERADNKDLWSFYEHLSDEIGLFELIEAGHLAPITVQTLPIEIDARNAKVDDYSDEGNSMATAIEPYWDEIIRQFKEQAKERPTLFFHPGIGASKRFTDRLVLAGVSAKHVDGTSDDRKSVIAGFERGDFQVLNNAQLLMKGFDAPRIECVVILRPTKSRVAYQQMVGRGTRLSPGKTDCLLLDFWWEFSERMQPCGPADLITKDKDTASEMAKILRKAKDGRDMTEVRQQMEEERQARFIQRIEELARNRRALRFDARDLATMLHNPAIAEYTASSRWDKQPATDRQKEVLTKAGMLMSSVKNKGSASHIIAALSERWTNDLATTKQVAILLARGVPDPHKMTFQDASRAINQLFSQAKHAESELLR